LRQRPEDATKNDAEYYVYDSDGLRVKKVLELYVKIGDTFKFLDIEEKAYLDGFERKRVRRINLDTNESIPTLERLSCHVMDDKKRIAIVHRWNIDTSNKETDDLTTVKVHYQLGNHLGSVSLEVDDTEQIISYEEYYPYGGTAFIAGNSLRSSISKEVWIKEHRYTEKERDDSTGLYYYGARYYIPWICRWISSDPGGIEDGSNLYQYSMNNPINVFDPNGREGVWNNIAQVSKGAGKAALNLAFSYANAYIETVAPVISIYRLPGRVKAFEEARKKEGLNYALNEQFNPAFHTLTSGYETKQSIEKRNYEGIGEHAVETIAGAIATVGLARAGAGLANIQGSSGTAGETNIVASTPEEGIAGTVGRSTTIGERRYRAPGEVSSVGGGTLPPGERTLNRTEAFNAARHAAKIPYSQQPIQQGSFRPQGQPVINQVTGQRSLGTNIKESKPTAQGRYYKYEIPKEGGGTQTRYIIEHDVDPTKLPHFHAAENKPLHPQIEEGGNYKEYPEKQHFYYRRDK
jgi:RHS repeat-associated protein